MPTFVSKRLRGRLLVALFALVALPLAALAQGTAEQEEACTPDAVKLCASAIPDIPKVTACMKAHVAQLSPRCRAAFNDATSVPAKAPKPRVATREERRVVTPPPPHPRREATVPRTKVAVARPDLPVPRRLKPREDDGAPAMALPETPVPPEASLPDMPMPVMPAPLPKTHVLGLRSLRAQIAQECREGLIDPFTCRNTFEALRSIE